MLIMSHGTEHDNAFCNRSGWRNIVCESRDPRVRLDISGLNPARRR
jgi:hypothetical protein